MKFWKKNLFKNLAIKFFLFFAILLLLYLMIDVSIRSNQLSYQIYSLEDNILYYLCTLSKRLDFLCCFSFLLATITCYTEMHSNRELLALQTSGICTREFTQPIYIFTILLAIIFLFNFEFSYPKSALFLQKYESSLSSKKLPLIHIPLKKEQFLISATQFGNDLEDVFYVTNTNTIFHMQKLILSSPSKGYFVTEFKKNENQEWERIASYPHYIFINDISTTILSNIDILPFESRPLSNLFYHSFIEPSVSQLPAIRSYFFYKIIKSVLPILCIIAISNGFGVSVSRKYFFFYCVSLCNGIGMYAIVGFLLTLGTSSVCSSYLIIGIPIAIIVSLSQLDHNY